MSCRGRVTGAYTHSLSLLSEISEGTQTKLSSKLLWLVVCAATAIAAGVWLQDGGSAWVDDLAIRLYGTPHQRYGAALKRHDFAARPAARLWLDSAAQALAGPATVKLPHRQRLEFTDDDPKAAAFAVSVRRGQRYVAEARVDGGDSTAVILDVFERDGDNLRHVTSAAPDERAVILELRADAEYIVRVQSELHRDMKVALELRAEPTLFLPVARATRSRIQSYFGDPRDNGRRAHHGVDIFAPRGTPVLAAAGGIVTSVGTNGLGGNVVWIARPGRREAHYYAHLEHQLVTPGTFVAAGDVIGTVGNTGNARGTLPHLHFGIYTAGGAVDPLPYIAGSLDSRVPARS
jgi:murein DD-endopeptidase MepM/ murein hydrolase activator NlpD